MKPVMSSLGMLPVNEQTLKYKAPKISSNKPNGIWDFPEQMGVGVGFIYVIFDTVLKRAYLGKKSFTKTVKGRTLESDWKDYKSSSKLVAELLSNRPLEEFEFICLEMYKTRGTLSYAETWSLCFAEVPTTRSWYNTRIEAVAWSVKEPVSTRHKERLLKIMERMKD